MARGAIGVNDRIVAPLEGIPMEVIMRRMLWTQVLASVHSDGGHSETLVGRLPATATTAAVRRALRAPVVVLRHRSPTRRIIARVDASCGRPPVGVWMSVGVAVRVGALKRAIPEEDTERVAVIYTGVRPVPLCLPDCAAVVAMIEVVVVARHVQVLVLNEHHLVERSARRPSTAQPRDAQLRNDARRGLLQDHRHLPPELLAEQYVRVEARGVRDHHPGVD